MNGQVFDKTHQDPVMDLTGTPQLGRYGHHSHFKHQIKAMIKVKTATKVLGLFATTALIGVFSLKWASSTNATSFQNLTASYASPVAYNPSPQHYIPGTLAYTHSRINVRTGPGKTYYAKHYGLKGDRVTLLNQAWGHDGYQWWYLRFNQSGAKGWVRADLVQRH